MITNKFKIEDNFSVPIWGIFIFLTIETFLISYLIIKGKLLIAFIAIFGSFFIGSLLFYNQIGFLIILFIQFSSIILYLFEGKGHYFRYFVLLVLGCWVINKLIHKDLKVVTDKMQFVVMLFWLLILISYMYALDPKKSIEYIWQSSTIFLIYIIFFLDVFKTKLDFKLIFQTMIISLFILSIIGLFFYIKNYEIIFMGLIEKKIARTSSLMEDPNHYALSLVTMLPFSLYYLMIAKSKLLRVGLVLGILLVLSSIFLTFSRGALVSLVIMITYMFVRERKLKIIIFIVSGIILISTIMYIFFPLIIEAFIGRIELISTGIDYSISKRVLFLYGGINMFLDHPILGVGAGNFVLLSTAYSNTTAANYAHNNFLEIGAELGIFGLFLFCLIIIITLTNLRRSQIVFYKNKFYDFYWMSRSVEIGLVGLLAGSMFLSRSNDPYFWSIVSFSVILKKLSNNLANG